MKKLVLLTLFFLTNDSHSAEKIKILTTFSPIYCFAKNVAGQEAEVENLLPANIGPHDYHMKPRDIQKIINADVIVFNGLGLEDFLEKALENNKKALRIDASKGIPTLQGFEELDLGIKKQEDHGQHSHEQEHEHSHPGDNPHIWLDPILAIQQVENIMEGLAKIDPDNAPQYKNNGESYIHRLNILHEQYKRALDPLPNKRMIAFHDAFPYLAKRYDIQELGVFQSFPGKEPSPKYLAKLIDVIKKQQVKILFSEPQYSPAILQQMARDTGAKTAELDAMEIGPHQADFYEEVAKKNLKTLIEAFQ